MLLPARCCGCVVVGVLLMTAYECVDRAGRGRALYRVRYPFVFPTYSSCLARLSLKGRKLGADQASELQIVVAHSI